MAEKKKKREKRKDELIRSNKTRKIIIIIIMGVLLLLIAKSVLSNFGSSSDNDDDYSGNYSGNGTMIRDRSSVDKITDTISGFIYGVVELEYPFMLKFLMFLGAIYIFQVGLSISGDIIQLFLIMGVAIYKVIKWVYKKIKKIDEDT